MWLWLLCFNEHYPRWQWLSGEVQRRWLHSDTRGLTSFVTGRGAVVAASVAILAALFAAAAAAVAVDMTVAFVFGQGSNRTGDRSICTTGCRIAPVNDNGQSTTMVR